MMPRQMKFKLNYPVISFIICLFIIYYAQFIQDFIVSLKGECPQGYALSDWLINYQGGFVRRGLAGELFRLASSQAYLYPKVNLVAFSLGLAVTFTLFILMLYRSSNLNIKTTAFFLLNPAGLPLIFIGVFYRKEMLFHAITIVHLLLISYLLKKKRHELTYFPVAFTLFTVIGSVAALTHESYLFMCLAPNMLLSIYFYSFESRHYSKGSNYIKALAIQIAPLIFCIIAFAFKGNLSVAQKIWNSIGASDKWQMLHSVPEKLTHQIMTTVGPDMDHAINGIGFSTLTMIKQQFYILKSGEILLWLLVITFSSYFAIKAVGSFACEAISVDDQTGAEHDDAPSCESMVRVGSYMLFVFLFLSTLPLYVVGIDYGRWLCTAITAYMIIVLFQPKILLFVWQECTKFNLFSRYFSLAATYQRTCNKYFSHSFHNKIYNLAAVYWLCFVNVTVCYPKIDSLYSGFIPYTAHNNVLVSFFTGKIFMKFFSPLFSQLPFK